VAAGSRPTSWQVLLADDPPTMLVAERLRDGRVALGTRVRTDGGDWAPGELLLLEPTVQLDLAAWLTPCVEAGWLDTVRQRLADPLRTAGELYGEGPGAVKRFALETLGEIPPHLLALAMILLANAVGPHARERLIERLNETGSRSEDAELRRRLAEENEAFAYSVAAASLFDALARGISPADAD
jgi:hypothetical protein